MARYALLLAVAIGVYLLATYMEKRATPIIKTSSYYYPGGLLMRIRCWLMHPFNAERRAEEELSEGRMEELALHPTVKPVQMIADAIRDVSGRGEIVLDVFGGSGSTLIAAEKTGRRARLCELDPVYCDRILARWQAYAKDDAEQLVGGRPVDDSAYRSSLSSVATVIKVSFSISRLSVWRSLAKGCLCRPVSRTLRRMSNLRRLSDMLVELRLIQASP